VTPVVHGYADVHIRQTAGHDPYPCENSYYPYNVRADVPLTVDGHQQLSCTEFKGCTSVAGDGTEFTGENGFTVTDPHHPDSTWSVPSQIPEPAADAGDLEGTTALANLGNPMTTALFQPTGWPSCWPDWPQPSTEGVVAATSCDTCYNNAVANPTYYNHAPVHAPVTVGTEFTGDEAVEYPTASEVEASLVQAGQTQALTWGNGTNEMGTVPGPPCDCDSVYNQCVSFFPHPNARSLSSFDTYVCTYVCMYVCVYVCIDVYMYICIYVYRKLYLYMYIYIYMYAHVCMYVCIYIYIYTCMPAATPHPCAPNSHARTHIHPNTHTYTYAAAPPARQPNASRIT